jgi:hypothetical protein
MNRVLPTSPDGYIRHALHAPERVWTETSCSCDVWIEVLHTLGLEPLAALGSTLSSGVIGDQWRFLKIPPEDLRLVYGIGVDEFVPWRPLAEHVERFLADGHLLTVEVDSWFLPDTAGRGYHHEHAKSTIVPNAIDLDARHLEYFHNVGYHRLLGADFDGVFAGTGLAPYVEVIRLDGMDRSDPTDRAVRVATGHFERRPTTDPISSLARLLQEGMIELTAVDESTYQRYVFGTIRQCGATAELAGSFVNWLGADSTGFTLAATYARSLLFKHARFRHGRNVAVEDLLSGMARGWADGLSTAAQRLETWR